MSLLHKFLVLFLLVPGLAAVADELVLLDGSRIKGTLIESNNQKLVFKTSFAGAITVDSSKVKSIITVAPVTVQTVQGELVKESHFARLNDQSDSSAADQSDALDLEDIAIINPKPWQLGEGYKWSGNANTALQLKRGNSKSDEYEGAAESIWKSIDDRYTLRGNFELDESAGTETKNNWKLQGKYDHTIDDSSSFFGFQASFEQDKFSDIDLRTIAGPYIGRELLSNDYLKLFGEVGVVYVDQAHIVAADNDYVGSNWELRLTSDWFGGGTQFYINQDGVLNFDAVDEMIFNTVIGISLPLVLNINAGFEIKYEYDGGAADNIDELDETYSLKLGYSW